MTKTILILLIVFTFVICCNQRSTNVDGGNPKSFSEKFPILVNSKWKYNVSEDCINYFEFNEDNQFVYSSCETEDKSFGKYFVKNDTLYLDEFISDSDSLLSSIEYEQRSQVAKYKIVMKDGKLMHVEKWSFLSKKQVWEKDEITYDSSYLFEKYQ